MWIPIFSPFTLGWALFLRQRAEDCFDMFAPPPTYILESVISGAMSENQLPRASSDRRRVGRETWRGWKVCYYVKIFTFLGFLVRLHGALSFYENDKVAGKLDDFHLSTFHLFLFTLSTFSFPFAVLFSLLVGTQIQFNSPHSRCDLNTFPRLFMLVQL